MILSCFDDICPANDGHRDRGWGPVFARDTVQSSHDEFKDLYTILEGLGRWWMENLVK